MEGQGLFFIYARKNYTKVEINPNPGLQFDWQAVRAASGDKWNEKEKNSHVSFRMIRHRRVISRSTHADDIVLTQVRNM